MNRSLCGDPTFCSTNFESAWHHLTFCSSDIRSARAPTPNSRVGARCPRDSQGYKFSEIKSTGRPRDSLLSLGILKLVPYLPPQSHAVGQRACRPHSADRRPKSRRGEAPPGYVRAEAALLRAGPGPQTRAAAASLAASPGTRSRSDTSGQV